VAQCQPTILKLKNVCGKLPTKLRAIPNSNRQSIRSPSGADLSTLRGSKVHRGRKETHGCGERTPEDWKTDYQAQGVLSIPEKARFATLLNLPEGADIGKAINEAMKSIEAENEDLKDVLPRPTTL